MPNQDIPIIDLSPYFEGTTEGKLKVAQEVDKACREIGFLVITGHQIDPNFIKEVYNVSEEFFFAT